MGKPTPDVVDETLAVAGEYVGVIACFEIAGTDVRVVDHAAKALAKLARVVEIFTDSTAVNQAQFEATGNHCGKISTHRRLWQGRHGKNRLVASLVLATHGGGTTTQKNTLP